MHFYSFPLLLKLTKRKQGRGRKILTAEETDREREGNENKGAGVEPGVEARRRES